jgi:dehydrogenase/reductase SDR family member 7B
MKDKIVIITGASSGIGKALAFSFGNAGAKIVITGRKAQPLAEVSQELTEKGIENFSIISDVSVEADNIEMVKKTIDKYGKIDILINNAGITMRSMFEDADPNVLKQVMDINYMGVIYATKYALPYIKQAKGSIIGISSIAGYRGLPVRTGYSASKYALNGFLEALRTELLHDGVHVLTASPGFTASNIRFSALGKDGNVAGETVRDEAKMMTSEEVADKILRATISRKREIIMTTQGKMTVFLNKWLGGIMDKMVYNNLAKEKDSPLKKN